MRFGHFDDQRREYVITTPDTPEPWINYLGCEQFFSLISHLGGGYCFYKDARLRRLLRYRYNSAPADVGGRYFYIWENGEYWNPTFMPTKRELDSFECRHGLGYSRITGQRNQLSAELLCLVPIGRNAEGHQLTLRNHSRSHRTLKLFSYVEFCLWNAYDDATNLQKNLSTGEVEVEGATVYHKTEYRERRNHFAFYHVNAPIVGFDTDREVFLGRYRGPGDPQAVLAGASLNSVASGGAPIASHSLQVDLAPGEEKIFIFVLGYVENPDDEKWHAPGVINKARAHEIIAALSTPDQIAAALADLTTLWSKRLSTYTVEPGDPGPHRMVNHWNQ